MVSQSHSRLRPAPVLAVRQVLLFLTVVLVYYAATEVALLALTPPVLEVRLVARGLSLVVFAAALSIIVLLQYEHIRRTTTAEKLRLVEVLSETSLDMTSAGSRREVARSLLCGLARAFHTDLVAVILLDAPGQRFAARATTVPGSPQLAYLESSDDDWRSWAPESFWRLLTDGRESWAMLESPAKAGPTGAPRSLAGVRLGPAGQPEALIVVGHHRLRQDDDAQVFHLEKYARPAGAALTGARLLVAMRAATQRILDVQDAEWRRIAEALHDSIGGILYALSIRLAHLRGLIADRAEAVADVDACLGLVADLARRLRDATLEIYPPGLEEQGLAPALALYADSVRRRSGVEVVLSIRGPEAPRLPAGVELGLYRIAQEAVTNALKHARPRRVELALTLGADGARLVVVDDGQGLWLDEPRREADGWGLVLMEQRAEVIEANIAISSAPGVGTALTVELRRA